MAGLGEIAIIGSGGIGGYLAGSLVRSGHRPTLCVRSAFDTLRIDEKGEVRTVDVPIVSDPAALGGPARWVLLTTKAQDTATTAPWLEALVKDGTTVVVIQNGTDHERRVSPYVPKGAAVLPAIIHCSVERTVPGRIVHHGGARMQVPAGTEGAALGALFAGSGFEVIQEEDFLTVAWSKLLSNAVANPITALTLRRMTVFTENPVRELSRGLMQEVVAVARAEGADISEADGDVVLGRYAQMGNSGTSMLYDRLLGRPLEHMYISGAVVASAERHGINVPLNKAILALLSGASGHAADGSG